MTESTEDDAEQSPRNERKAKRFEQVVVAISVVLTVALIGYATWQMFTVPTAAAPQVSIKNTEKRPDGNIRVTIAISNSRDQGLEQATVRTNCQNTSTLVEFNYVPAGDTQTAQVVCPSGTNDPEVTLSSWIR
jgi:uncharacterized protein (TIGR02588 family)